MSGKHREDKTPEGEKGTTDKGSGYTGHKLGDQSGKRQGAGGKGEGSNRSASDE